MYIQYGNYQHAIGEGAIRVTRRTEYSRANQLTGVRVRFEMQGRIQIDDTGDPLANQAAMTDALNGLEAAYAVDGYDFGLYEDDGTPTQHVLLNATTLGGVKVTSPLCYPVGAGAEYSTFRNYELAVEGFVPNVLAGVVDWQETVRWSGGGPDYVFLQTLAGPPQKQLRVEQTTYKAVQSGYAVGNLSYVSPPGPLWPYALQPMASSVTQASPERMGPLNIPYRNYRTTWTYSFEDVAPLFGAPNFWSS